MSMTTQGTHAPVRDANEADRLRRERFAPKQETGTLRASTPQGNARQICYNSGLPEGAAPFVQRVLDLEAELFIVNAQMAGVLNRLAALENKIK